jgi:hypothetical protein
MGLPLLPTDGEERGVCADGDASLDANGVWFDLVCFACVGFGWVVFYGSAAAVYRR